MNIEASHKYLSNSIILPNVIINESILQCAYKTPAKKVFEKTEMRYKLPEATNNKFTPIPLPESQ